MSSNRQLGMRPPGREPAMRRDRGLPAFSLAVGRGPTALDDRPDAAPVTAEPAANAHTAAVTGTDPNERSNRLVAFQRIVDANHYGPLRWPDGPSDPNLSYTGQVLAREGRAAFIREMFAEAFSMWRTERSSLQSQAPALVTFFDNSEHLR